MHCDMLNYLAKAKDPDPARREDIGCAIPCLREGNVKLQIMAIYTATEDGSAALATKQGEKYQQLLLEHKSIFSRISSLEDTHNSLSSNRIGTIASIENASGLCEEDEPLENAFTRLEHLIDLVGGVLYISLTHQGENRFGGGNLSTAGLKDDGGILLEYISGRRIAADLSHTSAALANDILEFIDKKSLSIPVIASHSNFRSVYEHERNLTDEAAREIIRRRGLIGINFIKDFLHTDNPGKMIEHIQFGFELGGKDVMCFGADYFPWKLHMDKERAPFFFQEHEHAGKYQEILQSLEGFLSPEETNALAYANALGFIQRLWDEDPT